MTTWSICSHSWTPTGHQGLATYFRYPPSAGGNDGAIRHRGPDGDGAAYYRLAYQRRLRGWRPGRHLHRREGRQSAFRVVAKICDALYCRFSHSIASRPRGVTAEVDKDYAAEAAAYEHMTSVGRARKVTPTYYGSCTFGLPILGRGVQQMRPIRLVLIEHLQRSNLQGLRIQNSADIYGRPDSFHLAEGYGLEVLARAMDAYVRGLDCGVEQNDFASRHYN